MTLWQLNWIAESANFNLRPHLGLKVSNYTSPVKPRKNYLRCLMRLDTLSFVHPGSKHPGSSLTFAQHPKLSRIDLVRA